MHPVPWCPAHRHAGVLGFVAVPVKCAALETPYLHQYRQPLGVGLLGPRQHSGQTLYSSIVLCRQRLQEKQVGVHKEDGMWSLQTALGCCTKSTSLPQYASCTDKGAGGVDAAALLAVEPVVAVVVAVVAGVVVAVAGRHVATGPLKEVVHLAVQWGVLVGCVLCVSSLGTGPVHAPTRSSSRSMTLLCLKKGGFGWKMGVGAKTARFSAD